MSEKLDKAVSVTRDLVLLVFGLSGIAYQQVTGEVNFVLLAIFTTMTGIPGLVNLLPLLRGLPTDSQSSAPASTPPHSDSPNVSEK